MVELESLIINNGVGVFFGFLFYQLATSAIKQNTGAINSLRDAILGLRLVKTKA